MFDHPSFDQHERVVLAHDAATGLRAIVAIHHCTARAAAASGCRALSALFDADSIPKLHTTIVAGCANNLPATAQDGARLQEAGVLYAPDYVIDAGGIICVGREYLGGATAESSTAEIHQIPVRPTEIFARSSATNRPTSELADEMSRQLFAEA